MLLITDNLPLRYLEANDKFKLSDFLNAKRYKVSDMPLSYRQANSLDEDKLLTNDRKSSSNWRKFSFKELVYILIVNELKKFGIKHKQLKNLWDSFFKDTVKPKVNDINIDKFIGECAIGCTFAQVEIEMSFDSDGNIKFYDPFHSVLFDSVQGSKPVIKITLNDIVNDLLPKDLLDRKLFSEKKRLS